jgi:hypothetical protein
VITLIIVIMRISSLREKIIHILMHGCQRTIPMSGLIIPAVFTRWPII